MSVADQARAFLSMALCGGVLGAVYDALGMLRRGAWLTALADLCFGLCAAGGVIVTTLFLEAEPFRLYVPLGAALGFALYACSLGTAVRFCARSLRVAAKKAKKMKKLLDPRRKNTERHEC